MFAESSTDDTPAGRSYRTLGALIRALPDACVLVHLPDGRIVDANDRIERLSGYRAEQVIGRLTTEGLWPDAEARARFLGPLGPRPSIHEKDFQFRAQSGDMRTVVVSAETIDLEGAPHLLVIARDVTGPRRAQAALAKLAEGRSGPSEQAFFDSLMHSLCEATGADRAFMGLLDEARLRVQTLAGSARGTPLAPFSYALDGAPCERVMADGLCCYPSGVQRAFPRDVALSAQNVEGYLGCPFADAGGPALGLMVALFEKPIPEPELVASIVRIYAARASAELIRFRTEESLKQSEAKYRQIIDFSPIGFFQGVRGRLLMANQAFAAFLGYDSVEEVLNLESSVYYFDVEDRDRHLAQADTQEGTIVTEVRARRKDGSPIWGHMTARAVKDATGRTLYYEGFVSNIARRKAAEEALTESARKYRSIVDFAPVGFYQARLDGQCIMANQSLARILGYDSADELLKLTTHAFYFDPSERDRVAARYLPQEKALDLELRWRRRDGSPVWIALNAHVIPDASGSPAYIEGFVHDISARKGAEEEQRRLNQAVEEAAAEWQRSFDAVDSGLIVFGREGRVKRLNRAARELLGGPLPDVAERSVETLPAGEPWRTAAQVVREVQATGAAAAAQARDEARRLTWDLSAVRAIASGVGNDRIILAIRDITGLVELQESLRRSERMSAMGSLVAGVAHEVRNPLFSISASLDALQAQLGQQAGIDEYWLVLRNQVTRLTQLMHDLLEFGKPQNLRPATVQLKDMLARSRHACALLAEQHRVRIEEELPAGLPALVVDHGRIEQVFENLLANAIQHSPSGGRVRFIAKHQADAGTVACCVHDSGPGVAPADLTRVFEPFFSRRKGGTGLGLSIVQRIVEAHGGAVRAENAPDGGACFTIVLPERPATPTGASA